MAAVTNMHELAFGITSENPVYGDVDNPRKSGYIAGGSSGGSAAAVAINAVPFALGTDTGGSVRIPAALCGVVGYRPTVKLYDASVVLPLSSTTDTIGINARCVEVIQKVHKTIIPSYSPTVRQLTGLRVGIPRQYFYDTLDSEVSRVTEAAIELLKKSGIELVEANFPPELSDELMRSYFDLSMYETAHMIPKYLQEEKAPVTFDELCEQIGDPIVKNVMARTRTISEECYSQSKQVVKQVCQMYDNYFETNSLDFFVVPTTILPALRRPSPTKVQVNDKTYPTMVAFTHNTFPQAIAGVPSISLPSGMTADGLPLGMEVIAPRGMDSDLLDVAFALQAILPSLPQLCYDDFKDKISS